MSLEDGKRFLPEASNTKNAVATAKSILKAVSLGKRLVTEHARLGITSVGQLGMSSASTRVGNEHKGP